jgi:hypothetical protein
MIDCERSELPPQLKVNNILAKHVWLRAARGADEGEVVVEDSLVGVFALHNHFDLLLKEGDSEWRPIELDELRSVLLSQKCPNKSKKDQSDPQPAQLSAHRTSNEDASASPKLLRVGEVTLGGHTHRRVS